MKRTAASRSEGSALARIDRILEQAAAEGIEAAEPAVERNQYSTEHARADQARIDKGIRDRLVFSFSTPNTMPRVGARPTLSVGAGIRPPDKKGGS
jgi:hypothetical protein